MKIYIITGGVGFIGSHFVRQILRSEQDIKVINLDKLTYAGNLESLFDVDQDPRYTFVQGDIGDRELIASLLAEHKPTVIVNFCR